MIGVTIIRIDQLLWLHLFVGLLLIGPVTLKMASTGYPFARYYTHDPAYRRKGPPEILLRLIAPIIVLTTVVVFASGVVLLFVGPADRGQLVLIHKVSFIVWGVFTALHALGHLQRLPTSLRAARRANPSLPGQQSGTAGRWIAIAGALVGGLVLAVVLIPDFARNRCVHVAAGRPELHRRRGNAVVDRQEFKLSLVVIAVAVRLIIGDGHDVALVGLRAGEI